MMALNGKLQSKRFLLALIGFCGCMVAAIAKNWIPGIDNALVIAAAGLITAYIGADSWRPSRPELPAPTNPELPTNPS